jgi:hypothetical protein
MTILNEGLLSEILGFRSVLDFGFFWILQYSHLHNEQSWVWTPKSKHKIHLCSICTLSTDHGDYFIQ